MEELIALEEISRRLLAQCPVDGVDGDLGHLAILKQERNKGQDNVTTLDLLMVVQIALGPQQRNHVVKCLVVGVDGVLGVPVIPKQERKKGPDNVTILHLLMEEHNVLDQIKRKLFVKVGKCILGP